MANLNLGDVVRARVGAFTPEQAAINTYHFKVTNVAGAGMDPATVASQLDTAVSGPYKAAMSVNATYRGVSLQKIWPLPVSRAFPATAIGGAGSVAGDALPGQVTGIISFSSDLAGRKERGRVYIPFPSEADSGSSGLPSDAYVGRINAIATVMLGPITVTVGADSVTLSPVIYHRVDHTTSLVTILGGKKLWATQRRRGSYGRRNTPPF